MKRKRTVFWHRNKPKKPHDIASLMPADLPKGERFETQRDVNKESRRSQRLLGDAQEAKILCNCRRDLGPSCARTYCPICARDFRKWFIGELLRITEHRTRVRVLTILLQAADRKAITQLAVQRNMHALRKRLLRSGLGSALVVGGVEVVYRAREHRWILHINLVIIGGDRAGLAQFQGSFDKSEIDRPVQTVKLRDRAEQLSYVLKFTTYHRPYAQRRSVKSPAKPLNRAEHRALVAWMQQYKFTDMMFLFNARRQGSSITITRR